MWDANLTGAYMVGANTYGTSYSAGTLWNDTTCPNGALVTGGAAAYTTMWRTPPDNTLIGADPRPTLARQAL